MLKIQLNLTHEKATNHSQTKLTFFILKDEQDNHWLLPFKPEIDVYKPKVVKGKITPPELNSKTTSVLPSAKVYDIEDWMNDDSIDETIEQLIYSPRLNKMDTQIIAGDVFVDIVLNSDTGKFVFDHRSEITLPMKLTSYGIHAVRTNTSSR